MTAAQQPITPPRHAVIETWVDVDAQTEDAGAPASRIIIQTEIAAAQLKQVIEQSARFMGLPLPPLLDTPIGEVYAVLTEYLSLVAE